MKRNLMKGLAVSCLAALLLVSFTACGSDSKGQQDDGQETTAKAELVNTRVTGEITLSVKGFEPDYVLDDTSPTMAVVRPFQGVPFFLRQDYTVSDKLPALEEGKTYVFVIEEKYIGKLTREQFEAGCPKPAVAIELFDLQFKEIREAKEDEMGTGQGNLIFEEI